MKLYQQGDCTMPYIKASYKHENRLDVEPLLKTFARTVKTAIATTQVTKCFEERNRSFQGAGPTGVGSDMILT